MGGLDAAVLAERTATVQRHLRRVANRLPAERGALRPLADHGVLDRPLAEGLGRAARFRNLVAHAYADLDLARVHDVATQGPADLLAFLAALRDHLTTAADEG